MKSLQSGLTVLVIGNIQSFDKATQAALGDYSVQTNAELTSQRVANDVFAILLAPDCEPDAVHTRPSEPIDSNSLIISCCRHHQGDLLLGDIANWQQIESALKTALKYYQTRRSLRQSQKQQILTASERENLSAIGVALSAEKDLDKLLSMVLQEGRKLGRCEGASLYLVENAQASNEVSEASNLPNKTKKELVFKLTQNSKVSFDFNETRFPLTNKSLAGYVALTGEILNIPDVYELDASYPFSFDKSFDQKISYRSKELLVLPMKNHKNKVIGVLQFVNNFGRIEQDEKKASTLTESDEALVEKGFSDMKQGLLEGLASQAAVAIDNSHLIENIQNLFEGFVSASVNAIESRDPVTSGHSFRVAELTIELAKMVDREDGGSYKHTQFSNEQLRELRYASLLHDFGKVGVKENVLLKANKLHHSRFQYLNLKIEWQKQILQNKFYQQLLRDINDGRQRFSNFKQSSAFNHLAQELKRLDEYKAHLAQANRPSVLDQSVAEELTHMSSYNMHESFPDHPKLINQGDFLSLSIKRGSLTESERLEIQSHVSHTQTFLATIPWTDELSSIPEIAGAHHEKLDGTGYPFGLKENEIPIGSKIMTIADIYDALTARDRPYKKAVPVELALDILKDEAKNNKIDSSLLATFIDSKAYQVVE